MAEYIEKPDMQYILHIKSDKKVEQRLIDYLLQSVVDVFEDTGLTAGVQPVKRGEWEKKSSVGVFRCSLCQHIFMLGADEIDEYYFCPNCGADMRGDENA